MALAGVETAALGDEVPELPGIVVFDEADDELVALLHELSSGGRIRVLAVASTSTPRTDEEAWRLLSAGASDVLVARVEPAVVGRYVAARLARWQTIDALLDSPMVRRNLIGRSACWKSLLGRVVEVAHFSDAPVLILGESGTGKELIARLVHTLDMRSRKRELITLDCSTLTPELAGSEFFGHERGAFTGAVGPRDGAFALADGGSLFLDEIGELPLTLQSQLLRVVQEHSYKRVGGNGWRTSRFRLLCATNRDLPIEVAQGQFRHDLYHRVAHNVFRLPTLHERRDDILPLTRHFLSDADSAETTPELDPIVRSYLMSRDYPGNVRELEHLVRQLRERHVGDGPITVGDIPEHERPDEVAANADWRNDEFEHVLRCALHRGAGLRELGEYIKETAIRLTVSEERGNLQRAARKLGVTDRTLQLRRAGKRPAVH